MTAPMRLIDWFPNGFYFDAVTGEILTGDALLSVFQAHTGGFYRWTLDSRERHRVLRVDPDELIVPRAKSAPTPKPAAERWQKLARTLHRGDDQGFAECCNTERGRRRCDQCAWIADMLEQEIGEELADLSELIRWRTDVTLALGGGDYADVSKVARMLVATSEARRVELVDLKSSVARARAALA